MKKKVRMEGSYNMLLINAEWHMVIRRTGKSYHECPRRSISSPKGNNGSPGSPLLFLKKKVLFFLPLPNIQTYHDMGKWLKESWLKTELCCSLTASSTDM